MTLPVLSYPATNVSEKMFILWFLQAERLVPTGAEVLGNKQIITEEWAPSRFERGLAAMMFVLPVSEGVFR